MSIGTPYLVCSGSGSGGTTTFSVTVSTVNTSGDLLAAWVTNQNSQTVTGVSDPVNGNWIAAGPPVTNGGANGQWWYLPGSSPLTTSQNVKATFSGNTADPCIFVIGCSGLSALASALDLTVPATGNGNVSVASGVLGGTAELVLAGEFNINSGGATTGWSAPFTQAGSTLTQGTGHGYTSAAYDVVSANTSVTGAATLTGSHAWLAQLVSFVTAGEPVPKDRAGAADAVAVSPIPPPYLIAQAPSSGHASVAATVATPNNSGDLLAAWVTTNGAGDSPTGVSDPVNGAWTAVGSPITASSGLTGQWFIFPNSGTPLTTSQAVTATFAISGGSKTVTVIGCPGLKPASPMDPVQPVGVTGISNSVSASTGLRSAPIELVLAGEINYNGGGAPSWSSPFTVVGPAITSGSNGPYASVTYDVVTTTASVTASATVTGTHAWGVQLLTLMQATEAGTRGAAGATDSFVVTAQPIALADTGAAIDTAANTFKAVGLTGTPGRAGGTDSFQVTAKTVKFTDTGAAATATISGAVGVVTFTPAAGSVPSSGFAAEYLAGRTPWGAPAPPLFLKPQLPRMYLQNLVTGQWVHRDVPIPPGPQVTWTLNAPGTATMTFGPPRADLLDASGNPIFHEWQTACYLEESGQIVWGGICTQAQPQGASMPVTFTEFSTYPNGIPYEGPDVSRTDYDALDAVRALWAWLQSQPGGNLGMQLDSQKAGVLIGDNPTYSAITTLAKRADKGDGTITIVEVPPPGPGQDSAANWPVGSMLQVGTEIHKIKSVQNDATSITLWAYLSTDTPAGGFVGLVTPETPYALNWWNATDCGQEIQSILGEVPCDFRETHTWADSSKQTVVHRLSFGVPRIGTRKNLRFVEGENIIVAAQGNQDGSVFGNQVTGMGAGTGSTTIRATAAVADGRLRRVITYQNQTVTRVSRMRAMTQRVLASVGNIDTVTQIQVIDHPNAPFGSFATGDDIPVQLCSGWRNVLIWSRITGISQVPGTSTCTLTLARSDSFSYLAPTGTAGSI